MLIDRQQLSALFHVLQNGSFEKAATALNVTPSAISQRIRALEERLGAVLIVRDTPCRPTPDGEKLYCHARQVEVLETDLARDFMPEDQTAQKPVPIAVNADSLATWFIHALPKFADASGLQVDIIADDQDHTAAWLKNGRVLAAVTSDVQTVQGCRIEKLGRLRYHAVASPEFKARYFPRGLCAAGFATAPMLIFNPKDRLQHQFMEQFKGGKACAPPCHSLPSTQSLVEAGIAGLGWGMAPESITEQPLKAGTLVRLSPRSLDIALYWQCWRFESKTLTLLTKAVKDAARENLLPSRF